MVEAKFGDIRTVLLERLESAERNIRIAMAWFTNQALFDILLSKAQARKKIEIILSDSEANFNLPSSLDFSELQSHGGKIYIMPTGPDKKFMHHKFAVVDNIQVITGSYNWSNNAQVNYENIIILKDEKIATTYSLQFDEMMNNVIDLNKFKSTPTSTNERQAQSSDIALSKLAKEFHREILAALRKARAEKVKLNYRLIDNIIKSHSAVGAAIILANKPEQSGFEKLIKANLPTLTFEYHLLKNRFTQLFDKRTKKNAREKLRPSLGALVDRL